VVAPVTRFSDRRLVTLLDDKLEDDTAERLRRNHDEAIRELQRYARELEDRSTPSFAAMHYHEETVTITTMGVFVDLPHPHLHSSHRFSAQGSGVRYNGAAPSVTTLICSLSFRLSSGSNRIIAFKFNRNGSPEGDEFHSRLASASDERVACISYTRITQPGDVYSVKVANLGGTENVIVHGFFSVLGFANGGAP
jgi:hypothetical protein